MMVPNGVPLTPLLRTLLRAIRKTCRPAAKGWEVALLPLLWHELYTRSGEAGCGSPEEQILTLWARLLALELDASDDRFTRKKSCAQLGPLSPSGIALIDRICSHILVTCMPRRDSWSDLLAVALRRVLFAAGHPLADADARISSLLERLALRVECEEKKRSASVARGDWRWDRNHP